MMGKADVIAKIRIEGDLRLLSPLRIGDGYGAEGHQNEADIHVLKDKNGVPFIPGTSLAGVLRALYQERYGRERTELLFGAINREKKQDLQSAVSIQDVSLQDAHIVVRDGVAIDDTLGIGKAGAKYDYEAIDRGAHGKLEAEVTIRQFYEDWPEDWKQMVYDLADLIASGFSLGSLTAKGFGRVEMETTTAYVYDFRNRENVKHWLLREWPEGTPYVGKELKAAADRLIVDGWFGLAGSLIVRDGDKARGIKDGQETDITVQLTSGEDGDKKYVIPGTTMKGVLRHGARHICQVLGIEDAFLDSLMGWANNENGQAGQKSRFQVMEVYISKDSVLAKQQSRNHIDRFTGGTMNHHLFTEKPLWPGKETSPVHIHWEIIKASDAEAGLALFLLKDLWTGHLTIGGESSIGRGRLKGVRADVTYKGTTYHIAQEGAVSTDGGAGTDDLEACAAALAALGKEGA